MARTDRRSATTPSRRSSALTTAGAISVATAVGLASAVTPAAAAVGGEDHLRPVHRGPSTPARHDPAIRVVTETGSSAYTVRAGDTVGHIALRTGTTVAAIVAANGLDARALIRMGQVLTIPGSAAAPAPAAPAPAPAPAPTTSAGSHTVVAGDSVWVIAKRYGTTVSAVVSANGLDSRAMIRAGQVLTIPGAAAPPAATPAPAAPAPAAAAGRHTVSRGETVSGIASRYGTTTAAIVGANGLDARALVRIGQVLTIPGSAAAPAPAAPAPAPPAASSHTVASGETVSGIAARYGRTTTALVSANGLDSRAMIRVGQVLTIPGASTTTAPPQLVPSTFLHYTYSSDVVGAANENKRTLLSMTVPGREQMQALVASTARSMGVDPALALAVAFQESGFDARAVSPANAVGVMQVIPSSGVWASDMVGRQLNLLDPNDNVVAGVAILRTLLRTSADLPTAVAGYYQGAGSVRRNGMYADTRRYVAGIQTLMTRFG